MNKVILFVLFISIISQISSISPPKFPVTFYTNVTIVVHDSNIKPIIGTIANDDANKLFSSYEQIFPGIAETELFNKKVYDYANDFCHCYNNVTYNDLHLPYFSPYKNFVKYNETDSEVIWRCTDTPPQLKFLFTVKKETPNVPESLLMIGSDGGFQNFTFIGFHASQPENGFFKIPDNCAKAVCH